jgi:hypothetical protein
MVDPLNFFHHAFEWDADKHRTCRWLYSDLHGALDGRRQQLG